MPDRPQLTHWGRVHAAVVWEVLTAALARRAGPLDVVDAGGGTGGFAVPLAALGHRVTVVDSSPDSLAALERRAAEQPGPVVLAGVQGDVGSLTQLVGEQSADVVLCHSVFELVDDPGAGLAEVTATLRPGGVASLLVANRTAAVLSRVLAGRFAEARHALDDAAGRWGEGDTAQRRFDARELTALVAGAGLELVELHGVRVFSDLLPGALLDADPEAFEQLVRLELAAAGRSPYRDVATQLHVLARRGG